MTFDLSGDAISDDDLDAALVLGLSSVPKPLDWRTLDPGAAVDEWAAVDTWVRWLVGRYDIESREITPCWHQHGALVEELSALRGAHQVAFDPTQAASAAADWHRTLWDTRIRLRDSVARSGCTERSHHDSAAPGWVEPTVEYARALTRTVDDDTATRTSHQP